MNHRAFFSFGGEFFIEEGRQKGPENETIRIIRENIYMHAEIGTGDGKEEPAGGEEIKGIAKGSTPFTDLGAYGLPADGFEEHVDQFLAAHHDRYFQRIVLTRTGG